MNLDAHFTNSTVAIRDIDEVRKLNIKYLDDGESKESIEDKTDFTMYTILYKLVFNLKKWIRHALDTLNDWKKHDEYLSILWSVYKNVSVDYITQSLEDLKKEITERFEYKPTTTIWEINYMRFKFITDTKSRVAIMAALFAYMWHKDIYNSNQHRCPAIGDMMKFFMWYNDLIDKSQCNLLVNFSNM